MDMESKGEVMTAAAASKSGPNGGPKDEGKVEQAVVPEPVPVSASELLSSSESNKAAENVKQAGAAIETPTAQKEPCSADTEKSDASHKPAARDEKTAGTSGTSMTNASASATDEKVASSSMESFSEATKRKRDSSEEGDGNEGETKKSKSDAPSKQEAERLLAHVQQSQFTSPGPLSQAPVPQQQQALAAATQQSQMNFESIWNDDRKLMLAQETCIQKPYMDKKVWQDISTSLMNNSCFQGVPQELLSGKEVQATFRQLMIEFEKVRELGINPNLLPPVKKALYEFLEQTRMDMLKLLSQGREPQDALAQQAHQFQQQYADSQRQSVLQQFMNSQQVSGMGAQEREAMSMNARKQQQILQQMLQTQGGNQSHQQSQQSSSKQRQVQEIEEQRMALQQQHMQNMQNVQSVQDQLRLLETYQAHQNHLEQKLQALNAAPDASFQSGRGNPADLRSLLESSNGHAQGGQKDSDQQRMLMQLLRSQQSQQSDSGQQEQQQEQESKKKGSEKEMSQGTSVAAVSSSSKANGSGNQFTNEMTEDMAKKLMADSPQNAQILTNLIKEYNEKKRNELEEWRILQSNPGLLELVLLREQNLNIQLHLRNAGLR